MRAAKAAKDGMSHNGPSDVASAVAGDASALMSSGGVIDWLVHAALPSLKPLVDDLCDKEPHLRGVQTALWLLERAGCPLGLLSDIRGWSLLPKPEVHEVHPPADGKQESEGVSPKTAKIAAAHAMVVASAEESDDIGIARHAPPQADAAGGGSSISALKKEPLGTAPEDKEKKQRRRVSLWQQKEDTKSKEDSDHEDERDSDHEREVKAMSRIRGSMARPSSSSEPKPFDNRRRRFTVNLSQCVLDLPDPTTTVAHLRKVPQFMELPDEDLQQIASKCKCNKYEADENLMVHGYVTDRLHVIIDGESRVCVPHQVAMMKPGDHFGAEALSLASSTSDWQITASGGPITTISISGEDYQKLGLKSRFKKVDKERKARPQDAAMDRKVVVEEKAIVQDYEATAADRVVIARAIKANKLLGEVLQLDDQQCSVIADSVFLIKVAAGEILFRKHDRGQSLYIVHEGLLSVELDEDCNSGILVRAGDSFGELAILYDSPRTATISAVKESFLWVLSASNFKSVAKLAYSKRMEQYTSILSGIPFLTERVPVQDISMLADVLEEFTVYEGENVCVAGEDEDFLFMIFAGECMAIPPEDLGGESYKMGPLEVIGGEAQLCEGVPQTHTVRALTEVVTILALDKSSFETVVQAHLQMGGDVQEEQESMMPTLSRRSIQQVQGDKSVYAQELMAKKMVKGQRRTFQKMRASHDIFRTSLLGGLGEGAFGCVVLLEDKTLDTKYALKALDKEKVMREKLTKSVQNERTVMCMLDSDFIVRLYMTYQDSASLYFMIEPAIGGELFDAFTERDLFGNLVAARFYISCVTLGLSHMHLKRVIYRDLKLENCLLDATGYLKLADMGIAKVVIGKTYTICGTADYFAPETLKQVGHNRAVDWWACGVLLFVMSTGRSPFDAPDVTQIYKNIIKGMSKVKFPETLPSDLIDVVKGLCRKKPEERVTMQKGGVGNLQEMGYFSDMDWEKLTTRSLPAIFVPDIDLGKIAAKKLSRNVELTPDMQVWDGTLPEDNEAM